MGTVCSCCCLERTYRKQIVDWEALKQANTAQNTQGKALREPLLLADENQHSDSITKRRENQEVNTDIITTVKYDSSQLLSLALELETKLDIKDREFRLKKYPNCFIASELVAQLIQMGYAMDDHEGIKIGRNLHRMNIIQHVTDETKPFKNKSDRFWKFTKSYQISKSKMDVSNINTNDKKNSSSSNNYTNNTIALNENKNKNKNNESSFGSNIAKLATSMTLSTVTTKGDSNNENNNGVTTGSSPANSESSNMSNETKSDSKIELTKKTDNDENKTNATNRKNYDRKQLQAIGNELELKVELKDREWRLKTYTNCFTAIDLIEKLIECGYAGDEDTAVDVANKLRAAKIIQHISGDSTKTFKNKSDKYWKFLKPNVGSLSRSATATVTGITGINGINGINGILTESGSAENSDAENENAMMTKQDSMNSESMLSRQSSLYDDEPINDLIEESEELQKYRKIQSELTKQIKLSNQTWLLKKYEECAVAGDIVVALIYKLKCAVNENEAIKIGQTMMDLGLLRHVGHRYNNNKVKFSNDKSLYLHFINFESLNSVQLMWEKNDFELKTKLEPKLDIKDRVYRTKKHKQCFRGSDWVKVLKQENVAMTKLHAKDIGTKLISLGYIEHVSQDQQRLKNHNSLWYRFV